MLNFSIKTPKKQLHQSFQMVKFLVYCYSGFVLIQNHCSLNCKKKKKSFLFSQLSLFPFLVLSSLSFLLSLLSLDGCDPVMVLVRQWFWFSNGGPLVMGSMWFNGSLWFDGLPLFSLRGSVWIKGVVGGSVGFWFGAWIEAWV